MDVYEPDYRRPPKEGMGCVAKGCIALVILGGILIGLGIFGGVLGYRAIRGYLADKPANIQTVAATDEQYAALLHKMEPFANALETNRRETLELTADELNILVARDPKAADLRGKAFFSIAHDEVTTDFSVPVGGDEKRGKAASFYFNGRLVAGISIDDGEVELLPHDLQVNGKTPPGWAIQLLQSKDFARGFNRNFNEEFHKDPKVRAMVSKLRSVRVVGDHLVLTSVGEAAVAAPLPSA